MCPRNFPLSNNCSELLFCFYFCFVFYISSILACLQVVYSSKYCCRRSIRLFDWICCGIYHPTSISILQVHYYPYRNRYHFCVLKISFIFYLSFVIQYKCGPFLLQEILEIYLWSSLQRYVGILLTHLVTLINAIKMGMRISHLANGYAILFAFLSLYMLIFAQVSIVTLLFKDIRLSSRLCIQLAVEVIHSVNPRYVAGWCNYCLHICIQDACSTTRTDL